MRVLRIRRSLYDRCVETTDEQVQVLVRIAVHLRNFLVKKVPE